jgi:hypothetical protein
LRIVGGDETIGGDMGRTAYLPIVLEQAAMGRGARVA